MREEGWDVEGIALIKNDRVKVRLRAPLDEEAAGEDEPAFGLGFMEVERTAGLNAVEGENFTAIIVGVMEPEFLAPAFGDAAWGDGAGVGDGFINRGRIRSCLIRVHIGLRSRRQRLVEFPGRFLLSVGR